MADEEHVLDYSTRCELEKAADILESLAQNMRRGCVRLTSGTESIYLGFDSPVEMEVEAKTKPMKGKGKLQIKVAWRKPLEGEAMVVEAGESEPLGVGVE